MRGEAAIILLRHPFPLLCFPGSPHFFHSAATFHLSLSQMLRQPFLSFFPLPPSPPLSSPPPPCYCRHQCGPYITGFGSNVVLVVQHFCCHERRLEHTILLQEGEGERERERRRSGAGGSDHHTSHHASHPTNSSFLPSLFSAWERLTSSSPSFLSSHSISYQESACQELEREVWVGGGGGGGSTRGGGREEKRRAGRRLIADKHWTKKVTFKTRTRSLAAATFAPMCNDFTCEQKKKSPLQKLCKHFSKLFVLVHSSF